MAATITVRGITGRVDLSPSVYYKVTQDGPGTYTVERHVWSHAWDTLSDSPTKMFSGQSQGLKLLKLQQQPY